MTENATLTSDITDITWDMMSAAGIDISLVERRYTDTGYDEYILIDGDVKVAFGPGEPERDGGEVGWNVATYETGDAGDWNQTSQDYATTPAGVLRLVAGAVA